MRLSSIFTLICALAAFILSLLCLLAGSSTSFLQNADVLTLNISRIGHGSVFNVTGGNGGFLSTIVNTLEGDINNLVNGAVDEVASALNLTDFYGVHIMNYCDGFFEPNSTAKNPSKNTTFCTPTQALFHFNPTQIVQKSLPKGISLSDIHWPKEIQDASNAVHSAAIAMFVFYVIGIAFAGLGAIFAALSIFSGGRASACGEFLLCILAFFTLLIASAISTAIMVKAVNAINHYGNDIGVSATKGATFLGLTWGAMAAALVAALLSTVQCIAGRKKQGSPRVGGKSY